MAQIPKIILDPQNELELLDIFQQRVLENSGGKLNDFRAGSPLQALLEGQVFAIAELQYYLNLLPEALALETFRLLGVQRLDGTKAKGILRFVLSTPLASNFVLPQGYSVPYNNSLYVTLEQVFIPSGAIEADVSVEALEVGSAMNAPEYSVVVSSTGVNYLQSIYNPFPITGGTDLEELTDTIERAQAVLRSREVLVTAQDYIEASESFLGSGRAVVYPFLTSDKLNKAPGQVHVFICDSLGAPGTQEVCDSLKGFLSPRCFAASDVWVSPMHLEPITIELTIDVDEVSENLAQEIAESIYRYLSPLTYPWGSKLRKSEIAYVARSILGVTSVASVTLDDQPVDYLLPYEWSCIFPDSVVINMLQPDGVTATYPLGLGNGIED